MGFTTGFLGGIALTTSFLYLTVSLHRQSRLQQSLLLSQQNVMLLNVVEPQPPAGAIPTARTVRAGVVEEAKDRWNGEIEGLVRRVYGTDWNGVRADMEERIGSLLGKMRQGVVEKGKE